MDKLEYIALNTVLFVGSGVAETEKYAAGIMDRLLRPVVIPNEQAIRHLLKTLNGRKRASKGMKNAYNLRKHLLATMISA